MNHKILTFTVVILAALSTIAQVKTKPTAGGSLSSMKKIIVTLPQDTQPEKI